jgi:putative phosphoesterase
VKIIAITDIHGRTHYSKQVADALRSADCIVIAGDITDFGNGEDATLVLNELTKLNGTVFAVYGNCDHTGVNQLLVERNVSIHCESRRLNHVAFSGLGGSNISPFKTPQEYNEQTIERMIEDYTKTIGVRYNVFVSHAPPQKTKVDRTFFGKHVGSSMIRKLIETQQPDLVICGHIHEARGVDRIGTSIIINPGIFPKHYAVIDITENIQYELI